MVPIQSEAGWNIYTLTNPVPIEERADILIAFSAIYADGGIPWTEDRFPYPMDTDAPAGRSFIAWMDNTSDTVNASNLSSFTHFYEIGELDPSSASNWMIRGIGSPLCTPSDIPWVSVSPDNGTTAPGNSNDVTVTFDSTGLTAGTYTGNLCINSNDPKQRVVDVPISLTVAPTPSHVLYLPLISRQ
jgi:hypothetical protein